MRFRNILPVILAMAALSSCSVYRSVPTPDDVYYSPGREAVEDSYLSVDNNRKGRSYGRDEYSNPDDNYLRMRVRDRNRWSSFDDYAYMNDWQYNGGYNGFYSPYAYGGYGYGGYGYGGYGYGMGMGFGPYSYYNPWSFNSYWNSYYAWNSYYNPYCPGIIVGSGKTNPVVYNTMRSTNLATYNNRSYNNRNSSGSGRPIYQSNNGRYNTGNGSYYNNPNSSGGLRRVYPSGNSGSNGGYTPSYPSSSPSSAPVRSYSPSSSGGSRGGSSGGGGGASRPGRGG